MRSSAANVKFSSLSPASIQLHSPRAPPSGSEKGVWGHSTWFLGWLGLDEDLDRCSWHVSVFLSSVVQHIESELLNYTLFLNTYDDSALTNMIAPNTEVLLDQKIWVKLRAEGLDWNLLTLVTDSCWATNEPTSTAPQQYSLISNGWEKAPDGTSVSVYRNQVSLLEVSWHLLLSRCPNPSDGTVEIQGNGMGLSNVFSFNMFEFSGRSHDVYLHCMLELCPKPGHSCVPVRTVEGLSGKVQMVKVHQRWCTSACNTEV